MTTNPPTTAAAVAGALPTSVLSTSAELTSAVPASAWTTVCALSDILPDTGVCARVQGRHVAVFRLVDERLFAIDNIDPRSGASVLARGLVGNLGAHTVVASPLYKNHFDLATGACIEHPEFSVRTHAVRQHGGQVQVALA